MAHKKTTADLIDEVGQWAYRNFEHRHAAHFGMFEECGEAAHCILKRIQLIRGFENEEFFLEQLKDSFADCMIYLADFCYRRSAFFCFKRNAMTPKATIELNEDVLIGHILMTLGSFFSNVGTEEHGGTVAPAHRQVYNLIAQRMCTLMEMWATHYKFDLEVITWEIWNKVKKRDWKKNNKDGQMGS